MISVSAGTKYKFTFWMSADPAATAFQAITLEQFVVALAEAGAEQLAAKLRTALDNHARSLRRSARMTVVRHAAIL